MPHDDLSHDHEQGRDHGVPPDPAHPSKRPVEPEHPMSLEGGVVFGDTGLMLRILAEELLMTGITPQDLDRMSHDSNYQALLAGRAALGDAAVDEILRAAAARVGSHHHRTWESSDEYRPATLTVSAGRSGGPRQGN